MGGDKISQNLENGGNPFESESLWRSVGASASDFRGDVRTIPTAEMLRSVTYASMGDGVEGSDSTTNYLQHYIARLTSHDAALFVLSGTMGNLLALRSHLANPPYGLLCDARAHFLMTEAGGTVALTGATPQPVEPSNGRYITLEDIMPLIQIDDGVSVHMIPTKVIVIENTLRGMMMPFEEAERICKYAHERDIKVHLDGARLWEAVVASTKSPSEYLSYLSQYCRLFDTVTMCFSKGLGAPVGAVLAGNKAIIRQATWLRQSIGGSVRMPGLLTACALTAVQKTFEGGLLKRTHDIAKDVGRFWEHKCGSRLLYPVETNIVWLYFSDGSITLEALRRKAKERNLKIHRNRLVIHYQISDAAVGELKRVMLEVTQARL